MCVGVSVHIGYLILLILYIHRASTCKLPPRRTLGTHRHVWWRGDGHSMGAKAQCHADMWAVGRVNMQRG